MKNYFIGIFPDEKTVLELGKIARATREIFVNQGVNMKWIEPDKFHITLGFLGKNINSISLFFIKSKLKKIETPKFQISIEKLKLGISNNYRDLLFLSLDKGADELREIVPSIHQELGIKREQAFIPHISLGRISKDISDQEFLNLTTLVNRFNKDYEINLTFNSSNPLLIESDMINYKVIS